MQPVEFLETVLGPYQLARQEAIFKCPFCTHHKPKLSLNIDTCYWKCWVCDAKGRSLFSLIWRLNNPQILSAYRATFPKNTHITHTAKQCTELSPLQLPEEYRPLCTDNTFHGKRAGKYLKKRHVDSQTILHYKIGFASSGRYADRIILPSFDEDGRLNFFTGRTILRGESYKYLNPMTPRGYKNTIIFNELNINWLQAVNIVEGFMDMVAVGGNTIPLFGSTLSESSKLLLNLATYQPSVYVCLDTDARRKQLKLLSLLCSFNIECYDVDITPYKDVGEMPCDEFIERKSRAIRADRVSILRKEIERRT